MNDKLYEILKNIIIENEKERIVENQQINEEIILKTRKELEDSLQQNSHLLSAEMDLQTALKEFFNVLKEELDEYQENFEEEEEKLEDDDNLSESLELFSGFIKSNNDQLKFAIEVEKFEIKSCK